MMKNFTSTNNNTKTSRAFRFKTSLSEGSQPLNKKCMEQESPDILTLGNN